MAASAALAFVSAQGFDDAFDEFEEWDGEQLAKSYCASCHVYPEPDLLPRDSWAYTLDLMGLYFGYDDGDLLASTSSEQDREEKYDLKRYPDSPTLEPLQWAAIRDYYESFRGEPIAAPPEGRELHSFEAILMEGSDAHPITSMVRIAPDADGFILGDAVGSQLRRYKEDGELVATETLPGAIAQLKIEYGYDRAVMMGNMHPSNRATGSLLERRQGEKQWQTLAEGLHRPVSALFEDFDGDGSIEAITSEFGHYAGRLNLLDFEGGKVSASHSLLSESGAIGLASFRRDEDELPSVLALTAQAREGLVLFENRGGLQFEAKALLSMPPTFGYTQLSLVDMTGDGREEIVTVNGDNADLPGPPLKPYHGIRIYRWDGETNLEELAFLYVPGALQASLGDFDQDGLLDIATVSYFPDPRRREQGFVLFRNLGGSSFERLTISEGAMAPWMTIDAGDVDGDGDIDIVLGSGYIGEKQRSFDGEAKPSALLLRNKGKGAWER